MHGAAHTTQHRKGMYGGRKTVSGDTIGVEKGNPTLLPSAPRVGTRVDNALPRTWHRDLVFARTLLGSTPIGVLWLHRLQNGQRSQACYRLAVLSEYRRFVSNGKAGMVSGFTEHAHLFDLDDMHVGFRRAARAAATQVRFPPAS